MCRRAPPSRRARSSSQSWRPIHCDRGLAYRRRRYREDAKRVEDKHNRNRKDRACAGGRHRRDGREANHGGGARSYVIEVLRIAAGDTERMQNELKTNTTGTVKTVHVQEGATVETGAKLITVVAPDP